MSDVENPSLWTLIIEPEDGSKPEWAAWVTADDANWGTLRILHAPTQSIAVTEPVNLGLDISAFWTGRTSENDWEDLVRAWIRDNAETYTEAHS